MAAKKKEVKPISLPVAIIAIVLALLAMVTFVAYLVNPQLFSRNDDEGNNSVVGQSFTEESEDEPPEVIGEEKESFTDAEVNDIITFGKYKENAIKWQVLAKENGKILVLSRNCIEIAPYNTTEAQVSWQDASLRKWLSDEFLAKSFSDEEKAIIADTTVGETVTDKVFILSSEEAEQYMEYASWRKAAAENYISVEGTLRDGYCRWWLRNDGEPSAFAPYVFYDGNTFPRYGVDYDKVGVRPAMWITIGEEDTSSDSSVESEPISQ